MLHVGLLGARGFGQHHLDALQASPHVAAVTLAGRDTAALDALRARCSKVRGITADYRTVLADPTVDLVDIVLPHHLHAPVALQALEQGKHVLLEKPPARTPEEFQQVLDAAAAADRRLFVVMNLLYSPLQHAVRRAVDAGAIGRPYLSLEVNVGTGARVYLDPDNWRADRERCGGGLQIDGGFHAIYRPLYYLESLGAPVSVLADCAQIGVAAPEKGEDFSSVTLAYAGGERIHFTGHWTARASLGRFPGGLLGTDGCLLFTGEEEHPVLLRRPEREDEPLPVPEGPRTFADTVRLCVAHHVECLATGGEPWAGTDLAMLSLRCITGAYRSAQEGRRLTLEGSFRTATPAVPGSAASPTRPSPAPQRQW